MTERLKKKQKKHLHRFKTEIQRTVLRNPSVSDVNIILTSRIISEFKLVP